MSLSSVLLAATLTTVCFALDSAPFFDPVSAPLAHLPYPQFYLLVSRPFALALSVPYVILACLVAACDLRSLAIAVGKRRQLQRERSSLGTIVTNSTSSGGGVGGGGRENSKKKRHASGTAIANGVSND